MAALLFTAVALLGAAQCHSQLDSLVQAPSNVEGLVQAPSNVEGLVQAPSNVDGLVQAPSNVEGLVQSEPQGLVQTPIESDGLVKAPSGMEGLLQSHVLWRHGDRTPINFYPTDPYRDPSNWPVGLGQLTARGKEMHYRLGQWLRARYTGFLGSDYSEEEVMVKSDNCDRTLMSAEANLAGLFPPTPRMMWNSGLPWQPVPVHTMPEAQDRVLGDGVVCPRADQLMTEVTEGREMRELLANHSHLLDYLTLHSGRKIDSILMMDYLYDTLLIETIYNKTLPEWTQDVFPGGEFDRLRLLTFSLYTATRELARLRAGPFLGELLHHWAQLEEESSTDNKLLHIYSAHDTNVATILNALGVFNGLAPPYASAILVELLEREGGKVVRLAYRNSTEEPAHLLTLPGCTQLCPLDRFRGLVSPLVPADWEAECGLTSSPPSPSLLEASPPSPSIPHSLQLQLLLAICSLLILLALLLVLFLLRLTLLATPPPSGRYKKLDCEK